MIKLFKRRRKTTLTRAVETLKTDEQTMQDMLVSLVERRLREMPPEEALNAIKRLRGEA